MFEAFLHHCNRRLAGGRTLDEAELRRLFERYLAVPLRHQRERPWLMALAGSPGSGKSSFARRLLEQRPESFVHQIDETAQLLAEFHGDLKRMEYVAAIEKWSPRALMLVEWMTDYALRHNVDIIYDRSCNRKACRRLIKQARGWGYGIELHGIRTPPERSLERVVGRQGRSGVNSAPKVIEKEYRRFLRNWPGLTELADRWYLHDNGGDGERFEVIEQGAAAEEPLFEHLPRDRWLEKGDYLKLETYAKRELRAGAQALFSQQRPYNGMLFSHPLLHPDEMIHFAKRLLAGYPAAAEVVIVGESLSSVGFIQGLLGDHPIRYLPFTGGFYDKDHRRNEKKHARWQRNLPHFEALLRRESLTPAEIVRRHQQGRKTLLVDFIYNGRGLHSLLDLLLEMAEDRERLKAALELHLVTFGEFYEEERSRKYFDGRPFAEMLEALFAGIPITRYAFEQLGYGFTLRAWTDHMWGDRCVAEYRVGRAKGAPPTLHHPATLGRCNLARFAILDHLYGAEEAAVERTTMKRTYPKYNIAFVHGAIGQFKQLHAYLNESGLANSYALCAPGTYNAEKDNYPNLRVYGTVKQQVEKQFFYITKIDDVTRKAFGVKEAIEKLLEETPIDLIVTHVSGGPPLMLFDEIDIPVISYVEFPSFKAHGWDPKYPPPEAFRYRDKLMEMYYYYCCTRSDHVITPSEYAKRMLPAEFQHKTTAVMEGFKVRPSEHKVEIEREPGKIYIGFTARDLSSAKGFEQFVLIAKAILKKRGNVKFVVVGSPKVLYSYEGTMLDEHYGEKHGKSFKDYLWEREGIDDEFAEYFEFFDFMEYDQYAAYIELMDLFLYPLQYGSANWGIYELFSRGKLIIGSDRCYVPELITHEIDGFICDYDDIDQWVETAVRIIDQPERFECMRRNVEVSARKHHIEGVAEEYLDLFHRTIEARRG